MGDHRFRKIGDQWYYHVGLARWVKSTEPVRGKCLGHHLRPGTIFYGDPNHYEITWTQYEEVGNIEDMFYLVGMDATKCHTYGFPKATRAAVEEIRQELGPSTKIDDLIEALKLRNIGYSSFSSTTNRARFVPPELNEDVLWISET